MAESKMLGDYKTALNINSRIINCLGSLLPGEVTLNQVRILSEMFRADANQEYLEMRDLIVSLNMSRGSISRYVATLADRSCGDRDGLGLVKRTPDKRDRRVKRLSLTPKGVNMGIQLAEKMRRSALDHKHQIVEFIDEKCDLGSVKLGVDEAAGVVIYKIRREYTISLARQIYIELYAKATYQFFYDEIIDLIDATGIALSDKAMEVAIETIYLTPGATKRRIVYIATDDTILSQLNEMTIKFHDAGLDNFSVLTSLSEVKELLNLEKDWRVPSMRLLNLA